LPIVILSGQTPLAKEWMGTTTAREALGVGTQRLYRMIDTGKIPAYRIGRVIRLRRVDVERSRLVLDLERESAEL
jgi:excisionase family DNA binding protein